ncbi:MAG: hypothetical protein JXB13_03040 [Phycisphaerae bacterium]|nr:hypothetical protein [Phycisphaerae bacterium]
MKLKTAVAVLLLSFVGASLAYLVRDLIRSTAPPPAAVSPPASPGETAPPTMESRVIAYYFHGHRRCATCLAIESQAREALDEAFPEALQSGKLEWRVINVDEPAHGHFVREYGLTSGAVVLSAVRDGRQVSWKRLDRVWDLVRDELKFKAYVEGEAAVLLEPQP